MPLQPDDNSRYWPLLLTEELYLLPEDIKAAQSTARLSHAETNSTAASASAGTALDQKEPTLAKEGTEPAVKPQPDLLWGSTNRGVLVLVEYPDHTLMERTDGLFLVEILKAVGYDFKEVATLNVSRCKTEADWQYIQDLPVKWVVSFGVHTSTFPITQQEPDYQKHAINNTTVLLAESLGIIRTDINRKKKLWNLLKQAFV